MTSRFLFFGIFMIFIIFMLAMDLGVFHKKDHEIKMKEAGMWTAIWVLLSLGLALIIRLHAEWVHGIGNMNDLMEFAKGSDLARMLNPDLSFAANLEIYRKEMASQYLAGYFLEESLSIDNIFVMIMIFVSFGIDKKYYHRVLFWGIFGAIVIYNGITMFKGDGDEKMDTSKPPMVRFATKYFRATPNMEGHNFFSRIDGKTYMTPLFIVLLVIEFSDVIFAVDSIPAVFSVTTDTFIVYFSNIFAIMGLRSLFFLLSNVKDMFWLLKYGLGVLLCFIGAKMLLHEFVGLSIGTTTSLCVILGILVFSIIFSLLFPPKKTANLN